MINHWGQIVVEEGGIILPADLLADLGWRPDDDLTLEVIEDRIVIERAKSDAA